MCKTQVKLKRVARGAVSDAFNTLFAAVEGTALHALDAFTLKVAFETSYLALYTNII